jgi:branched-subunit amino acid ABC-type transport system permease component
MTDFLSYVLAGIPIGCVFALMAIGIVLTYKTSGVFNLAFGAQAFVSAAIYYDTVARHDWPPALAFVVAVVIAGPLLGLVLDQALYRHLRTAPAVAKLVTSLGLLVAIPQIVKLWFGSSPAYNPPGLIRSDQTFLSGQLTLDMNEIVTIATTVLVVAGLSVLFRRTNLGLQMRAVVESPRMTELNGVNASRVGAVSWMLSSLFAALAGVLLAPLFAQVSELNFFTLLVAALAAAAFGRLSSIPLTLAGALSLGVLQQLLAGYLPPNSVLASGLRPSLPFAALFLLLLFWPGLRKPRELADPLAGVDPPPPAPAAAIRSRGLTILTRGLAVTFIAVMTFLTLTTFNAYWVGLVTKGVILGTIFLSFVIITGLAGQVSLCQASFAAVGAFAAAQLVSNTGMSILLAMVIGAAISAIVGGLLALPALRLGGIYLALATLAFALMFETVLRPLDWISGGSRPPRVPRPTIGGIDFSDNKNFFLLALAILATVALFVLVLKRGSTGRFLDALRGSETAAASIGINPFAAKVVAFSVSAGIAGFGGALLASYDGRVNYEANTTYFIGLVWVVLVVTLGARSIQAAITAGLSFVLFAPLLDQITPLNQTTTQAVAFILFGLGALTYAKHPEGIIEAQTRASLDRISRVLKRGKGRQVERSREQEARVAVGAGR